jgi:hypothetical protein
MITRHAALPSFINVLMDEAARRRNGEAGRNKNNFYINVFGESGGLGIQMFIIQKV